MRRRRASLPWLCVGLLLAAGMACTRTAVASARVVETRKAVMTSPAADTPAEAILKHQPAFTVERPPAVAAVMSRFGF